MPPVPLLAGFHPDPSIVRTDAGYFVVTSSFEYLPGLPVYRSDDLEDWALIGHVATRPEQLGIEHVGTGAGVYAPTIRFHDGRYYVVVTAVGGRGNLVFSAEDPAGPWSDGVVIDLAGIDPDLAWDDDGTCYLTYSGFDVTFDGLDHGGIRQVRVDLGTGQVLEEPRSLWSGTGGMFPEAPHLYRVGEWWYLLMAEGGTERGHAISVARSVSPLGPFEPFVDNPVLTARGTSRPVQCTGHGDLVQLDEGRWGMVLLGTWTQGLAYRFAPLGRETYFTAVTWEHGWPVVAPVEATTRSALPAFVDTFDGDCLDDGWIAIRRTPCDAVRLGGGGLVLEGEGRSMDDKAPTFIGRRVTRHHARLSAVVVGDDAVGGISLRYDERIHYDLERQPAGRVVARAVLHPMRHEDVVDVGEGTVELAFELRRSHPRSPSCDLIDFVVVRDGVRHVVATHDGRYLSAESACSFTGRVVGVYAETGALQFLRFEESDL